MRKPKIFTLDWEARFKSAVHSETSVIVVSQNRADALYILIVLLKMINFEYVFHTQNRAGNFRAHSLRIVHQLRRTKRIFNMR